MRYLGVTLVVSCMVISSVHAEPQTDKQKRADGLFEEGRKLIEKKDYAGACAKFNEAIELDPDAAGTMLNLGLCNENVDPPKYKTALYWFRKAQVRATESRPPLPDYAEAAAKHTTDLASKVATIAVAFKEQPPSDTKVKLDGVPINKDDYARVEVDPGHHALEAGAAGYKFVHQEFDVEGKGGQTLTIHMEQGDSTVVVDRGKSKRKLAMILGISGGGLMLVAGVLGVVERSSYCGNFDGGTFGNFSDYCGGTLKSTTNAASDANHARKVAQWVATPIFVTGALGFAVATYLYLTAPSPERINQTVWAPTVGPEQVGIAFSGGF